MTKQPFQILQNIPDEEAKEFSYIEFKNIPFDQKKINNKYVSFLFESVYI